MDNSELDRPGAVTVAARRGWFTVEQANRALPLVQRIVSDVVLQYEQLRRLHARIQATNGRERRKPSPGQIALRARHVQRLNGLVAELTDIGCKLADIRAGMVDFPGRRRGQEILLCWRLGEVRLLHWHEPYAGFPARRPIDDACE